MILLLMIYLLSINYSKNNIICYDLLLVMKYQEIRKGNLNSVLVMHLIFIPEKDFKSFWFKIKDGYNEVNELVKKIIDKSEVWDFLTLN